jgi:eukaryotic-like serine/threonine-protein kinase
VTPADWERLRGHFERLCELDPATREARLAALAEPDELLIRLRRMLAADGVDRLRDSAQEQAPALHQRLDLGAEPDRIGERLGAWRIVSVLAVGGMGRVYRALRDDGRYRADAAIKIVARGIDAAHFEQERATLARLQHPGIARLLDGGECADGRPYLVMEYIDGMPIDRYCAGQGRSTRDRLRLVLAAARAVAYAHAHAVLHRDIKPDNVLVDASGTVKLLDFGVAKLLDVDGENNADPRLTAASYYTPRYAAPEQFAGQPSTTATDVFSLAVMLFELLAGGHPYAVEDDDEDLSRRLLTGEPTALPRALRQRGRDAALAAGPLRDLAAVLERALSREPGRRYQSMDAFADELERVLADRPVQTRAASWRERGWRWVQHHRIAAAAMGLGVLGLGLGAGLATWQAREAGLQRDAALLEAARAERVAEFLADVFRAPNPSESKGIEVSARELLDRGRQRIAEELGDDPKLRARMQAVIANTYRSLGARDEAEALLQQALAESGDGPRAGLLLELGWLHAFQARFEESAARLREAAEQAAVEGLPDVRIAALQRLATPLINLRRLDEAEAGLSQALDLLQAQPRRDPAIAIGISDLLGNIAYSRGELDRAESLYREVLAGQRALRTEAHVGVSMALNNLAAVAMARGRPDEGEALYREAVTVARAYFGVDNEQVALPLRGLGAALRRQARGAEALPLLREAAEVFSRWAGAGSRSAIDSRFQALELAILLGETDAPEFALLTSALAEGSSDAPRACHLDSLRVLAAPAGDASQARRARDCLVAAAAPESVQLLAEVALLRAEGRPPPPVTAALRARIAALERADPYLREAVEALAE